MTKLEQPGPKKRGGVRKQGNPKQRQRRSDFEYPCLEPSVSLGKRREEVEDVASYAHKLNPEDKAWMNQFMSEYNEANTKNAVFHTTAETRKICNDKNNARNRCQYTEAVAANRLNLVENDYQMEALIYEQSSELEDEISDWYDVSEEET